MIKKINLLEKYSGSSPLFPLPNFVMFPVVGNEFIIFEPRYKEMVKNIIENEKFITITLLKQGWENNYENSPEIYKIGTLCYLTNFEHNKNGNYKITLLGLEKVEINETEQTKSFRIVATTPMKEMISIVDEREKCKVLLDKFLNLVNNIDDSINFNLFSDIEIKLEMLVNLISMAMKIPGEEKQKLLELPEINLRYEVLLQFIDSEININKEIINSIPMIPFDDSIN